MKMSILKSAITAEVETRLYYAVLFLLPFLMALIGQSWLFIGPSGVDVWIAQGMLQEWTNPDAYMNYKTGRSIFYSLFHILYRSFGPVYGQAVATLLFFTILVLCMHAFLRMFLKPAAAFVACVALVFFAPIHGQFGGGITYHPFAASAFCALALWLTAFSLLRKQTHVWLVLSGFAWGVLLGTDQVHLFFMPVALGLVYFLYQRGKMSLPFWQVLALGGTGALLSIALTGLLSLSAKIPSQVRLRRVIKEKAVVVLFTLDNTYVPTFKNLFTQLGYPASTETRTYGKNFLEESTQAHILRFSYQ